MLTVFLENQQITAPIGWYAEERQSGVNLLVTATVGLKNPTTADDISETVDYTAILEIVVAEGKKERKLLESYAQDIIAAISERYGGTIAFVEIKLVKPKLAVPDFNASGVGIVLKQSYL